MLRRALVAIALHLILSNLSAQQNYASDYASIKNFTPPSPDVASLGRFGNMPVSLSSGIPEISIPIYTIKTAKLSLPVSLVYHASGIKVEDISSVVGLGWSLNAGGVVSRSVVSLPDETGILSTNIAYKDRQYFEGKEYSNGAPEAYYLTTLANGTFDSQSDIYNFSFPGLSGKFLYDINTKQIQYSPVDRKILFYRESGWRIIDDAGNKYFYTAEERTFNQAVSRDDLTAWYLTKIVSADNSDSIMLNYTQAQQIIDYTDSYRFVVNGTINSSISACTPGGPTSYEFVRQSNQYIFSRKLLSSIVFSKGRLEFAYDADRQDPGIERLREVRIINSESAVVRKARLFQGYFETSVPTGVNVKYGKRMKLNEVHFTNSLDSAVSKYKLAYEENISLPSYKSTATYAASMDYWGYNNGALSNIPTLLPTSAYNDLVNFLNASSAMYGNIPSIYSQYAIDRSVNPAFNQAGILKAVIYPTGGKTVFEYESNRVESAHYDGDYAGGLRVKRVASYGGESGKPLIKTYVYGEGGSGKGYALAPHLPGDFGYRYRRYLHCGMTLFVRFEDYSISANPLNAIRLHEGVSAVYPKVTEYYGYPGLNSGKIEYQFDIENDSVYNSPDDDKYWNFSTEKNWARGQLLSETEYKYADNGYKPIRRTVNTYARLGNKIVRAGYLCDPITVFPNGSFETIMQLVLLYNQYPPEKKYLYHFNYVNIDFSLAAKKLINSTTINYSDAGDSLTTVSKLEYGGIGHLYASAEEKSTSVTDVWERKTTKYAIDQSSIAGLGSDAYNALTELNQRNIVSIPIETSSYKNGNFLSSKRTDFKVWATNGKVFPAQEWEKIKTNAYEIKAVYNNYATDIGRPLGFAKLNDINTALIWDDYGYDVIATASNALPSDIAFTSFERNAKGGWTYDISGLVPGVDSYDGKYGFSLSGRTITKSGINPSKPLVVRYWSKGGSAVINGTSGTIKTQVGNWSLFIHSLSGVSSISVSGNVVIDDLAVFPEESQLEAFVSDDILGLIGRVDANGQVNRFQYDSQGRLIAAYDTKGNLAKYQKYTLNSDWLLSWTPNESMIPSWQATGLKRCMLNSSGYTTGNEEIEVQDVNIYSTSYGLKKWQFNGISSLCPASCASCTGQAYKCVANVCELGVKIYTYSSYNSTIGKWQCVYHYEWSDGSWSSNFVEESYSDCIQASN
jgi:YD repeat-containing protein